MDQTLPLELAGVDQWADSAIIIRCRCRCRVARLQQWEVRREYLRRLKLEFDSENIDIPLPHIELRNKFAAGNGTKRAARATANATAHYDRSILDD